MLWIGAWGLGLPKLGLPKLGIQEIMRSLAVFGCVVRGPGTRTLVLAEPPPSQQKTVSASFQKKLHHLDSDSGLGRGLRSVGHGADPAGLWVRSHLH